MSKPVTLTAVEQALVAEVAAWAERAAAEIRAIADRKLAVLVDAHGLTGRVCAFERTEAGWMLIPGEPVITESTDAPPEAVAA